MKHIQALSFGLSAGRKKQILFSFIPFIVLCLLSINLQRSQAKLLEQNNETPTVNDTSPAIESVPTIIFPTITPAPVNNWQPPLVDIPYAVGQFDHFYLLRPISVNSVNWPMPAYLYGYEDSETEFPHSGLDFDAPLRTPILAAAPGKVVFTGYGLALGKGNTKDPYGLAVVIRHDFSYYGYSILTVYAHMEKVTVEVGQKVKAGDEIGLVGLTGNTTGPHVHYEVRLEKDGTYYVQNPFLWMAPPVDCGIFVGRFVDAYDKYITAREVWITSLTTGESWTVKTYATQDVPNDPYYKENVALGDLPVGKYKVTYLNNYQYYKLEFAINPGMITFIYFKSGEGFTSVALDPTPLTGFIPPIP